MRFENQTIPTDTYYDSLLYSINSTFENSILNTSTFYGFDSSIIDSNSSNSHLLLAESNIVNSDLISSEIVVAITDLIKVHIDGGSLQLNSSFLDGSQVNHCNVITNDRNTINSTSFNDSIFVSYSGFITGMNFTGGTIGINTEPINKEGKSLVDVVKTHLEDGFTLKNSNTFYLT